MQPRLGLSHGVPFAGRNIGENLFPQTLARWVILWMWAPEPGSSCYSEKCCSSADGAFCSCLGYPVLTGTGGSSADMDAPVFTLVET